MTKFLLEKVCSSLASQDINCTEPEFISVILKSPHETSTTPLQSTIIPHALFFLRCTVLLRTR
jgi:hypothetical protein